MRMPVGDTELVGVGVGASAWWLAVTWSGSESDEIDGCPVVEEVPADAVCGGLTSQ